MTQQLLQDLATRALGHGLLHERADVVAPQRRHPDDARIAGLVGEQRLAVRVQVQDPRGGGDGQGALTTHLALHQPLELALEQSAAEGDGEGHHRGLRDVAQELLGAAEVGLLGGDLLPQRPRAAKVLAADGGLVHRAVMGAERGVADDGADGQEDEVGVAHRYGGLGLAAPGLEVDALDPPFLANGVRLEIDVRDPAVVVEVHALVLHEAQGGQDERVEVGVAGTLQRDHRVHVRHLVKEEVHVAFHFHRRMPRLECKKCPPHVPVVAGEEGFSKDVRNLCTVWNQELGCGQKFCHLQLFSRVQTQLISGVLLTVFMQKANDRVNPAFLEVLSDGLADTIHHRCTE